MSTRTVRLLAALGVLALGGQDVVLAAVADHPARLGGLSSISHAIAGPRYLLLVAAVALLASSHSLRFGHRNAWRVAVGAALLSGIADLLNNVDLFGQAGAVVVLTVLVVGNERFRAPSHTARARRGWSMLLAGELAVLLYGTIALYLLDEEFRHDTTLTQSIGETTRLLLLLPSSTIEPLTRHGWWVVDSVRWLSLAVVLVSVASVAAPFVVGPSRRPAERERARALVERWARTSLAEFTLLDDKTWFFEAGQQAFLSYKVLDRVAVVLGGPIGEPAACGRLVPEFLADCEENGLIPAFHQVSDADRLVLERAGLHLMKIGEEAVVPIRSFSLQGSERKKLRSVLRRVERTGHRAEVLAPPLDEVTLSELREVSDAWLGISGHRERTFTVGHFDEDVLRSCTVVVVRDGQDRIVAFANLLPTHHSGEGNFDLMRHRPGGVNGVMDYLFVTMIERFRAEGLEGMTLGLAPLAHIEGGSPGERVLRAVKAHGGTAFNFEGLFEFKAKWGPRWEPRYVAYRREVDLARIGVALARVGEVPDHRGPLPRIGAVCRSFPFTVAMLGLSLWLALVTHIDHDSHQFLLRHFGLSWPDLLHFQLWRLATATLIQPVPGLLWSNLLLLAIVLPLAEYGIGPLRTIAAFFVGDWASTVPVLAVLRIAAGLGDPVAVHNLVSRDSGSSSAAFAVAGVLAMTLPHPVWRRVAVVTVFSWNVVPLITHTRLFDAQHVLATTVGVVLALRWERRRSSPPTVPGSAVEQQVAATV
jgi:lysylphosphatidylglycerol synthetase-like protein (DUF2156 family)